MDQQEHVADYETISTLTGRMLEAARAGAWDHLTELEAECRSLVEHMKRARPAPLGGPLQQRKVQIIRKILADDAAIRDLTEPWMSELQSLLENTGQERRVRQAYDLDAGR